MTDKEVFEAVQQKITDPKVLELLRAGLADPNEIEDVKRALRYGDAAMRNPALRDTLYRTFERLLNVVKDDPTTRQMVRKDLRQLQKQSGDSAMSEDLNTANVEKAVMHDCAKHVVHEQWGKGQCIPGEHTLLDDGTVTHYDVMFEHGIEQNVAVEDLTVVVSESHMHAKKKKAMEEEAVTPEGGNDTSKAFKKGKPEMPLEKLNAIMEKRKSEAYRAMLRSQGKMEEEAEQIDEISRSLAIKAQRKAEHDRWLASAMDDVTPPGNNQYSDLADKRAGQVARIGQSTLERDRRAARAAGKKRRGPGWSPEPKKPKTLRDRVRGLFEPKPPLGLVGSRPARGHARSIYVTNEEVEQIYEAAKTGSVRYSDDGSITHRVLHSSGQNHLTITHHNEHPGNIMFHGKIDGHAIKFTANPKNKDDFDPSSEDIKRHLKQAHPSLPSEVHAKVLKHATSGLKHLSLDLDEETELDEKKLTPAEMKKREEVAKAMERENPGMPMGKKMAIATATAKKVAEAKAHTVPKTPEEKRLAALAAPHDKITHADVMVGRGVSKKKTMKEFVEKLAESLARKAD